MTDANGQLRSSDAVFTDVAGAFGNMADGDDRIRLRANKGAEGEAHIGETVATVILFWPAAPFIKGKDVSINRGTILRAYAERDTDLTSPTSPRREGSTDCRRVGPSLFTASPTFRAWRAV